MRSPWVLIRDRLDKVGVVLSGLCALHCLASVVLLASLGVGGQFLLNPAIHRVGLVFALLIAGVAIGHGALKHRQPLPFVIAMMGLTFMGGALAVDHGMEEIVLTVIGVSLVSLGHILNIRHCRCADH